MLVTFWLVFFVVFFGILIIGFAIHQSNVSGARNKQLEINLKANNTLKISKFNETKRFYINDYATHNQSNDCKKFVAVDNENKQICLIDYEKGSLIIISFSEILNYEIYENGSNATTGGNLGGLWSGIFAAETEGMCKELKLIIRLKKYDISHISYDIISNTSMNMGINKSTQPYRACISTLQEFVSFLEVIKSENKE
ncbi:MAG: hypothetical protein IJW24_03870 [Clostridia bacterium]|nr:hypothetical protein [Clostridia bacterium]